MSPAFDTETPSGGLRELLEDYERSLIISALNAADSNQRRAAAALGVLPSTLCEKMKRLGLRARPVYTSPPPAHETSSAG
jgi:DNA-binding NtrC family response regulator